MCIRDRLKTILDKLLYFDSYEKVDSEMSDSNIGGRKNKNISNHIFIANGIMNEVKNNKDSSVDLELLDISKCFDSLWTSEIMNDMYEVMKPNDKLSLMYRENLELYVAIKTLVGKTKRNVLEHIEMQGSVLAPIKTSVQIDTIGKECTQKADNLYVYKNPWVFHHYHLSMILGLSQNVAKIT